MATEFGVGPFISRVRLVRSNSILLCSVSIVTKTFFYGAATKVRGVDP